MHTDKTNENRRSFFIVECILAVIFCCYLVLTFNRRPAVVNVIPRWVDDAVIETVECGDAYLFLAAKLLQLAIVVLRL